MGFIDNAMHGWLTSRASAAIPKAIRAAVEPLETRTLLSAWSTIDTYGYPGGPPPSGTPSGQDVANSMVQDSAGNIYAAGQAYDVAGTVHGIVQERYAGSPLTSWTTIEDLPNATFNKMATDSAGDLFVTGESNPSGLGPEFVAVRPVGQIGFTIVNDTLAAAKPGGPGIVLDGSGNAFFDNTEDETVNGVSQQHWIVQKAPIAQLLSGQAAFTTVDDFYSGSQDYPHNITVIPGGSSAGLYVVGQFWDASSHSHWVVRKSADGGNTWSTVDDFVPAGTFSAVSSVANGVSGDLSGNDVYVVGDSLESVTVHKKTTQTEHWIVRKSSNGGVTWTDVDDFTEGVSVIGVANATIAYKVQSDLMGNMYVVGIANNEPNFTGIVRANTGPNGSWITVDSYNPGSPSEAMDYNLLIDSSNNHYECGEVVNSGTNDSTNWLIRTDASPTASPAAIASVFSSAQITSSTQSTAGSDSTDLLNRRRHRH